MGTKSDKSKKWYYGHRDHGNSASTLYANIKFLSYDDEVRTIVVTSAVPGEGKSTVSVALAEAIGRSGKRVLLVEGDMRHRTLAKLLDAHPAPGGIYALMAGKVRMEEAIIPTGKTNVFFLDAETGILSPPDLLASARFAALVESLKRSFSYVVFDTPPVGAFVDAAVLSRVTDGIVMVVGLGKAHRAEVRGAVAQLENADARILGTVVNFAESGERDYYYYYDK